MCAGPAPPRAGRGAAARRRGRAGGRLRGPARHRGPRRARRALHGQVLAEPAPYDTSRAYGLESLPTTVLLDRAASVVGTVVGWDAGALAALLGRACAAVGAAAPEITDEPPRVKPGCAAKSTYDDEMLALIESAGAADEMEEMFERGWTDGLPVVPPTRARVEAMLGGRDPGRRSARCRPAWARRRSSGSPPARCSRAAARRTSRSSSRPSRRRSIRRSTSTARRSRPSPAGQLVVVSGPVAAAIGLNSGMGVLGPGFRANLTIGRALRLRRHADRRRDARPAGPLDARATWARSGSASPRTRRAARGSRCTSSAVSRAGRRSSRWSAATRRCRSPTTARRARGAGGDPRLGGAATWSPNWWPLGAPSVFVICPEHPAMFAAEGWSKQRLREAMFDGDPQAGARAAPRRDDAAGPRRRPRRADHQVGPPEDIVLSSPAARRAVTRPSSGPASAWARRSSPGRSHGLREPVRRARPHARAARPAPRHARGRDGRAARHHQEPRRRVPRPHRDAAARARRRRRSASSRRSSPSPRTPS